MPSIIDDPVALQVVWTRLIAIADEAAATLRRTSFSPIVRESNDFACVIFDRDGNAIAENTIGIPSFNMTLSRTLHHFLRIRPAPEWRDGDVGICNDPWLTSGHLPDITIIAPVFLDGALVGWTGSIAHMADMGGALWSADTKEVYEEGLMLPPLLWFKAGEPNRDVEAIIRANSRLPDQVIGDIAAQVAAGDAAASGLRELMRREGIDDLAPIAREICARTERRMRDAIATIPDGAYHGTVDLDGTGEEPVHLEVAVTKRGDELHVDYAGTSPEVGRALNTVLNYTEAYTCYPIKCALDPATPPQRGQLPHDPRQRARGFHPQPTLPGRGLRPPARRPLPRRRPVFRRSPRSSAARSSPNPAAPPRCASSSPATARNAAATPPSCSSTAAWAPAPDRTGCPRPASPPTSCAARWRSSRRSPRCASGARNWRRTPAAPASSAAASARTSRSNSPPPNPARSRSWSNAAITPPSASPAACPARRPASSGTEARKASP